jgi:hypothetical protein
MHPAETSKMATLSYADCTYTVSLFRKGMVVNEIFGEHKLSICAAHPNELTSLHLAMINGPPATDGMLYYIHAQHLDIDLSTLVWLESKDEATGLQRMLEAHDDAENDGEYSAWKVV